MCPEGTKGGSKITPLHVGDAYHGNKGEYIVKRILAQQARNRVVYYHVEWEGVFVNTWESVEHLGHVDGHDALKKFQDLQAAEIAQDTFDFQCCYPIQKKNDLSFMFTFEDTGCKN
jgi:hypothetical protein